MTKILLSMVILASFFACGDSQNTQVKEFVQPAEGEYVEVLYFHGKQRCISCNAIERLSKELLQREFATQLREGKVILNIVDISTPQGEVIADRYEVSGSALYINKWSAGTQMSSNMTQFGFAYAKTSPERFKEGVKKRVYELLKGE